MTVQVPDKIKNIVVIKICCLGDIVFITPLLSALKKNYLAAKITLVTSDWIKNILPYIEGIDETIIFNSAYSKSLWSKIKGTLKVIKQIRKLKPEIGITTHRADFFGLILFLSRIKYRLGFSQTKFLNYTAIFDDTVHETKRYLNILRAIGIDSDERAKLNQHKNKNEIRNEIGINENDFLISVFPFGGVNPGTNMKIKRWEIEKYYSLINIIIKTVPGIKILVFEGMQKDEITDKEKLPDQVIIKLIKDDYISVSNVFIGGDTGSLHIAAAFGVYTLGIFGPSDPGLLAPLNYPGSQSINKYIWKKPYCSPCYTPDTAIQRNNPKYWHGNTFICNTGTHICIKDISVDEVFKELSEVISNLKQNKLIMN